MSELGASDEGLVEEPLFLKVRSRDTVLVGEEESCKVLTFSEHFIDQSLIKKKVLF